jgi:predicted nucleic acid-binding protein
MRLIIDTNWYISLLIKKNESRPHFILINPSIDIIISDEILNELIGKNKRGKVQKVFFNSICSPVY